jgi:hypothetical protein
MSDHIHPPYLPTEVPSTWGGTMSQQGQFSYFLEIERYNEFLTWSDAELQEVIDHPTGASANTARRILAERKAATKE